MNTWDRLGPLLQKSMFRDKNIEIKIDRNHGIKFKKVDNLNVQPK
jgi:hypothetical protein